MIQILEAKNLESHIYFLQGHRNNTFRYSMIICRLEASLFRSVSMVTVLSIKYYLHLTVNVHTIRNKVMTNFSAITSDIT